MTTYQRITCIFLCTFSTCVSIQAQTAMNTIGVGIGVGEGDASPYSFAMLYSISYLRTFPDSPFALELSAHTTGREYIRAGGASSSITVTDAAIADATAWYVIPEQERAAFRFGVGASVRHYSWMASSFYPPAIDASIVRIIEYALGFHGKAEYGIPLGSNLELAIRAQTHFFLYPFSRETTLPPELSNIYPQRALSLGAFFRVRF